MRRVPAVTCILAGDRTFWIAGMLVALAPREPRLRLGTHPLSDLTVGTNGHGGPGRLERMRQGFVGDDGGQA
jgi:hypothetical protein